MIIFIVPTSVITKHLQEQIKRFAYLIAMINLLNNIKLEDVFNVQKNNIGIEKHNYAKKHVNTII